LWHLPSPLPGAVTIVHDKVPSSTVRAWDWPTRVFHWSLVASIIAAYVSFKLADRLGDPTLIWHRWNGYFILVLVVFRLLWGFAGSSTARFASFVVWPWTALRYGWQSLTGRAPSYLGHNPLGTWMVLTLLAVVSGQATLGLFSLEHNELVAGPLKRLVSHETSEAITKLHVKGIYVIGACVVVHVLANALHGLVKNDPLIPAMIHGQKPQADYIDQREAQIPGNVTARAAACFVAALALVFGGITALGGRIF
jgi:cytochrome b